nr:hypothetical protein [Bradyrhizobium cajani]
MLGVIAIRLAVLVLVGWGLTLLPQQARDSEPACLPSPATRLETQSLVRTPASHVADAAFDDMRLHD